MEESRRNVSALSNEVYVCIRGYVIPKYERNKADCVLSALSYVRLNEKEKENKRRKGWKRINKLKLKKFLARFVVRLSINRKGQTSR